jgi:hypothetical protein
MRRLVRALAIAGTAVAFAASPFIPAKPAAMQARGTSVRAGLPAARFTRAHSALRGQVFVSPRKGYITTYAGGMLPSHVPPLSHPLWPRAVLALTNHVLLVADQHGSVVWLVNRDVHPFSRYGRTIPAGEMGVIAGNGADGFSGDGGAATRAEMSLPVALAVDGAGNLYIADFANQRLRRVSAGTGMITTRALISFPRALAIDRAGNILVTDDYRVLQIHAAGDAITTVAGSETVLPGYGGDGGPARQAILNGPEGIAIDGSGIIHSGHHEPSRT